MALIYFYDSTEIDKKQLSDVLSQTDHHWEFVDKHISTNTIHPDVEVVSVFVTSTITEDMLDAMPKLKLIACRSTGYNNVPLQKAEQRGITVVNVPSYGENTVAEYTFALMLALSRKIVSSVQNPDEKTSKLRGIDLFGKTLGVIGTGRIGQNVIKIANGFGMKVIAYDAYPKEELESELSFQYVDIDVLCADADIISLHAPYLPTTHHIINRQRIQLMKNTALIINTARGELIDTKSLTEALAAKSIAGAALDVVEGEGLLHLDENIFSQNQEEDSEMLHHSSEILALKQMQNVILTPHNAFNTSEAIGRINEITAKNIIDFWYGIIPNKINVPKISSGKLLLVRHAESEWNATGKWSGRRDVHLSEKGFHEAALFGLDVTDIQIDFAFCSGQIRTLETLETMLASAHKLDVPITRDDALDERDYGAYTGMNKWDMKEKLGEDAFNGIRRDWDYPIPRGETLKMVYERVVPYYKELIVPKLLDGKNILIVAHGNSLRALSKYLEQISDEAISDVEMMFGTIAIHHIDENGFSTEKEIRKINSVPPHA